MNNLTVSEGLFADTQYLSINNVSVCYNHETVVHSANLLLGDGQIGCILGPSGCGKSTLLRAVAGLEPLCSGSITMEGNVLSSPSMTLTPEKRQVGMVFQDFALFPHLTITENIAFGLSSWKKAEQKKRVQELLTLVGLIGMESRYPDSLSGGQQQRIALARAMAPRPKLLLLDEPFSGLDASLREELVPEIRDILLKEQISALLVTHDQMEAFAMADQVAVMNQGTIHQCDTPYNIYHEPKTRFIADFIGQGEFLHAIVVGDSCVDSSLGHLCSDKPHGFVENQTVEILVRPDDVLHDDDSDITAEIVTKQFRGSHFLYQVVLPSKQKLYCFASSHHNHAIGESIGIKLDIDHLVMFEHE
jgi:iron(III) transport system ATP-binding protein